MKIATRLSLLREQAADNESVEKAKDVAKSTVHTAANISGFLAWRLGKLLRIRRVLESVRKSYADYRSELNDEE
jgi:hypothetical protein